MARTCKSSPIVVELLDTCSDYWEVITIHNRLETVVRRIQKALADWKRMGLDKITELSVKIHADCISIEGFTEGDTRAAEEIFTTLAESIGWSNSHGILIGRLVPRVKRGTKR
jgi:hypothetical protein